DGDNFYMLRFLVYEMPSNNMEEVFELFSVNGGYNLSEIKNKIYPLEQRLKGDNPILYTSLASEPNQVISYENDYSLIDDFPSGSFDIDNNNCEHFANRCVLGMNVSELNDKREGKKYRNINIQENLNDTNSRLEYLGSYPSSKINEINSYKTYQPQGILMEDRIEVSPKEEWNEVLSVLKGEKKDEPQDNPSTNPLLPQKQPFYQSKTFWFLVVGVVVVS
ncbi:31264_t:CDS:2, partial [Racocetra persica]